VLRPGGGVIIAVPLVWEYDRSVLEHRYTGPELAALLEEWDAVEVVENGGRAVTWTTLTGSMLNAVERFADRRVPGPAVRVPFAGGYLIINLVGSLLDRAERRRPRGPKALPMNILVSARCPRDAPAIT
jgi:hypothetical protein